MRRLAVLPVLLVLGACATYPPSGPSAMVLPGTGRSFDQFRVDDMDCRQFASMQSGAGTQAQTAADSTAASAALGTAIGAVAGAALGGRDGAAAGAGLGLITGTVAGASAGSVSAYEMQRRYDIGYVQCMYSKGHRVPVNGRFSAPAGYVQQPAGAVPPPPPPGAPPPPPPR